MLDYVTWPNLLVIGIADGEEKRENGAEKNI